VKLPALDRPNHLSFTQTSEVTVFIRFPFEVRIDIADPNLSFTAFQLADDPLALDKGNLVN
jgi:hypothetical protein